jgi:hypothetical protein
MMLTGLQHAHAERRRASWLTCREADSGVPITDWMPDHLLLMLNR